MDNKNSNFNEAISQENVNSTNSADLKDEARELFDRLHKELGENGEITKQAIDSLEQNLREKEEYYQRLESEYQKREEELAKKEEKIKNMDTKSAMYDQMSALTDDPTMKDNIEQLREIDRQEKEKLEEENKRLREENERFVKEMKEFSEKYAVMKEQVTSFKKQFAEKYNDGVQNTVKQTKKFTLERVGEVKALTEEVKSQRGVIADLGAKNTSQAKIITDLKEQAVLHTETIAAMQNVSAKQAMRTLEKSEAFTQLGVKPIKLHVVYNGSIYGAKEGGGFDTGRTINQADNPEDCRMINALENNDIFIDARTNRQDDVCRAYVPVNDDRNKLKGYAEIDLNGRTLLDDSEKKALLDAINSDHGTAVRDVISKVEYNLGNEGLDNLTGLAKNGYSEDWLRTEGLKTLKEGGAVSIILIDGDKFKDFNTKYGYAGGDTVLKHIADSVRDGCRDEDCPIRKGGDEFVAYVKSDGVQAYDIAQRIQTNVRETALNGEYVMDGNFDGKDVKKGDPATFNSTVSVGVVEIRLSEEERKALTEDNITDVVSKFMKDANERLDAAKTDGVTGKDADGRDIKRAGIAKADPETERQINLRTFEKNYNELFNEDLPDDIRRMAENSMAEKSDKESEFRAATDKEGNISYYADTGYECIMLKSKAESGEYRLDIGGDMKRVDYDTFLRDYRPAAKEQLIVPVVDMSEKAYNNQQSKPKAFEADGKELKEAEEKYPNNSLPLTADDFHL